MLKKLTIFSLLILFLPFFQTCSDQSIVEGNILKNNPYEEEVKHIELTPNEKEFNLDFKELRLKKKVALIKFIELQESLTSNGYETGYLFLKYIEDLQWSLLPFSISVLINFLLVVLAFLRKPKAIFILGAINIALNILPMVLLYLGNVLEDLNQLKIGYFLLLFNLIIICLIAFQEIKTSGNRRSRAIARAR